MITVTRYVALYHTGTFYHVSTTNADGSPLRCRANGVCKTWKTRPTDFRLPVKHGLRDCFYLNPYNVGQWQVTDEDATEVRRKMLCVRLGLTFNTPDYALTDAAFDAGVDEETIKEILCSATPSSVG